MLDALEAPPLPLQQSAARDLIDGAAHVDLWPDWAGSNGIWITITLLLGRACLRFRDVQQIVTSMLPIGMIVTPIFRPIDQVAGTARMVFVQFNPLYHCVQMVRAPLLGAVPSAGNYIVVLAMAAAGWIVAYLVFARFRARIAYWS